MTASGEENELSSSTQESGTDGVSANWPDGEGPVRLVEDDFGKDSLIIDVDGFEGPLDLLLQLARNQKVDLAKISILALAEQYLEFIHAAKRMELELAADYLVMAAWLAYLKSRLLIPQVDDEEVPAEDMAARLAFRLQRLHAMREASAQLMVRNRLGRDVFQRGAPEPLQVETTVEYADNLVDLLKAYAERRQKAVSHQNYEIKKLPTWTLHDAREALEKLMAQMGGTASDGEWGRLDEWIHEYLVDPEKRITVMASSFSASLELVREGSLEIRQTGIYEPIFLRKKAANA